MSAPVLAFFNHKGGVGKTTTLYHLAWMFAKLGKRVLVADLDPQANLTSLCLEDELLERLWGSESDGDPDAETVYHAVAPLMEATGGLHLIKAQKVDEFRYVLPGDLRLSLFEDDLAVKWNNALGGDKGGLNVTAAFSKLIRSTAEAISADIVFIDVGPNLGAINRAAMVASDYVIVPLLPDLFSLQGLRNLGQYLNKWRNNWQNALQRFEGDRSAYPSGAMRPLGYVLLQHRERLSRFVRAHQNWADRIPEIYAKHVLGDASAPALGELDPNLLYSVRNYLSLMAYAHEARKPVFDLRPADGAIGAHLQVVREADEVFRGLAREVARRIGLPLDAD